MSATKTRIEPGAYRLTGITKATGQCDCCARNLTQRVFAVAHKTTGEELALGRRCAAKATGYAVTTVERQAAIAARIAEVARRRTVIAASYPQVAKAWADRDRLVETRRAQNLDVSAVYGDKPAYLGDTAAYEDSWWGGPGTNRYTTWQDYLGGNL